MNATLSSNSSLPCSLASKDERFDIKACYYRTLGCPFRNRISKDLGPMYCGDRFGLYDPSDVVVAFINWVLPLFGLLVNMHFAGSKPNRLGSHPVPRCLDHWGPRHLWRGFAWLWGFILAQRPKHFESSVLIANPIGAIWRLGLKLDLGQQLWEHCSKYLPLCDHNSRRCVANVCSAFDDLDHTQVEDRVNRLIKLLNLKDTEKKVLEYVKETSHILSSIRVRNVRHAISAVFVYFGIAIANLLTSSTSSGLDFALPHTIAFRELCFFIPAQVILSCSVGAWSHPWAPQTALRTLATRLREVENDMKDGEPSLWESLAKEEPALWNGGSCLFRLQRTQRRGHAGNDSRFCIRYGSCQHYFLGIVAFLIVFSAFLSSFITSFNTPTKGIGGRSLAEICYFSVWIVNFFFDLYSTHGSRDSDSCERFYHKTWRKDGFLSFFIIIMFFLPFLGKWCFTTALKLVD